MMIINQQLMLNDEIVLIDQYLRQGDYVTLNHRNYLLCSQGFKQQILGLKNSKKNLIESVFVLESVKNQDKHFQKGEFIMFGQKIYLRHLLSKKYLSYSIHSNQDDIYLKSTKSANCIFVLKPLLKLQSDWGRKIRIGDQIQIQSPQKLSLYIQLGTRDEREAQCMLSLSKYQKSDFFISRFNNLTKENGQLTNINIYQLLLVENDMKLFASPLSQNEAKISLVDNINPYGSFLVFQDLTNHELKQEQVINYNQSILIRFFTHSLYFGFDAHLKVKLFNKPCEECIFFLENYQGQSLKQLSVLKLKHKLSDFYVGWERQELVVQSYKLKNLFYVKRVDFQQLKVAIIINNIYSQLFNIFQEKNMIQFKSRLHVLLNQLIRVIYGSSFNHDSFLNMNMKMELKIGNYEQNLLVQIGFLDLILNKVIVYLELMKKSGSEEKRFYQQVVINMIIIVAGICHKNQKNGEVLVKYLSYFFKAVFNVPNMIEAMIYLLSERIMFRIQTNEVLFNNKKTRLVNILLDQIQNKRFWSPKQQLNIFKFLQKLLISKDNQKYLVHEHQIMKAFQSLSFSKIFYKTKFIEDQIIVEIEGQEIELSDVYQKKGKYSQYITIINAQLQFLCNLFSNTNSRNLQSFQRVIPQEVSLNYIKSKMQTDYKKIFLKAIDQVYLCKYKSTSSKLLQLNGQGLQNGTPIDRIMLINLKEIIFQSLKHILENDLQDRNLYMYVTVICHLSKLNQLQGKDWEIMSELQGYLCRKYAFIKNSEQFEKLSVVVLQLYQQHENFKIQRASQEFVKSTYQKLDKKRQKLEEHEIKGILQQVLGDYHSYSLCKLNYQYISLIIATSVQQNISILKKASEVMNNINKSQYRVVQRLKELVLIGPQEKSLLNQLSQLHKDLNQFLQQYSNVEKQEDVGLSNRLLKTIRDINSYFFAKDSKGKHEMSSIIQNIIRQNSFFGEIMSFVQNSQLTYKLSMNQIILAIIDYLSLYTYKNHKNFSQLIANYHRFKWLFFKQSFGQHKLLYIMVFHQEISSQMKIQLVIATLESFRKSSFVNCYGVMGLIKLAISDGKKERSTASIIERELISNPSLVSKICKTDAITKLQTEKQSLSTSYNQILYYWFLVIRLFITVTEYCNEKDTLREVLKKHLTIKTLLTWFTSNSSFSTLQIQIANFMLKQQIINYCLKYYENQLFSVSQKQDKQYLRTVVNNFSQILQNYEYGGEPKISELVGTEIYSLLCETLRIRDNFKQQNENYAVHVHYNLLAVFYPFLLNLSNSVFQISQVQNMHLKSKCTYKLKELIAMISSLPKEYALMKQNYTNAIIILEDLLKTKLKFIAEEDFKQKGEENDHQTRIFRNKRLDTLIINLQASKDNNKVINEQIYAAILVVVFSPNIRQFLEKIPNKIHALSELAQVQSIHLKIYQSFKQNQISFDQALKFLYIFLHQHPKLIEFILKFEPEIFKNIVLNIINFDIKEVSKDFLAMFFFLSNYLVQTLIQSNLILKNHILSNLVNSTSKQRKKILEKGTVLLQYIFQTLENERRLYGQMDLLGQIQVYQQANCLLNCEQVPTVSSVQQILKYTLNKFVLTFIQNKEEYVHAMTAILQLIKSYTKFIKTSNLRFVPRELFTKLNLCCKVARTLLTLQSEKNVKIMLDNLFYNQFNTLLMLDDSIQNCLSNSKSTPLQGLNKVEGPLKSKLRAINHIYTNSCALYGQQITFGWSNFPLLNMPPHYSPLKTSIIEILKQLKNINSSQSNEFLLHINEDILMENIIIVYNKYYSSAYDTKLFDNSLQKHDKLNLPLTFSFENGINLTSLIMYIQQKNGNTSLQKKYIRYCEYKQKNKIQLLKKFFTKNKDNQQHQGKILQFFYTKMGRVEILSDNKLYSTDFIVYPECLINVQTNKKLLKSINFVSTQLKIDSLKQNSLKFSTLFSVYQQYSNKYCNIHILKYIDKYLIILKIISLGFIILENIVLLTSSDDLSPQDYFHSHQFFRIIIGINIIVEITYFIIYTFKAIPIILGRIKNKQPKDQTISKTSSKIQFLVIKQLFKDWYFIYCIVVLLILLFVLLSKEVVAAPIISLLIEIPQMDIIFKTLWRAITQIMFAVIAFSLFGYYYSIIVYFIFNSNSSIQLGNFCDNIGSCYNLVVYLYYRVRGGFPGLLYQIQLTLEKQPIFQAYDIFADFYVILVFVVFDSVILSIIVNELSTLQKQQITRRENMQFNCLICGLPGITFNKSSIFSFKTHISSQHNLHNYLYYYYYLSKKPSIDRNHWEQKIILDSEFNWFPTGYAKGFVQIENSNVSV